MQSPPPALRMPVPSLPHGLWSCPTLFQLIPGRLQRLLSGPRAHSCHQIKSTSRRGELCKWGGLAKMPHAGVRGGRPRGAAPTAAGHLLSRGWMVLCGHAVAVTLLRPDRGTSCPELRTQPPRGTQPPIAFAPLLINLLSFSPMRRGTSSPCPSIVLPILAKHAQGCQSASGKAKATQFPQLVAHRSDVAASHPAAHYSPPQMTGDSFTAEPTGVTLPSLCHMAAAITILLTPPNLPANTRLGPNQAPFLGLVASPSPSCRFQDSLLLLPLRALHFHPSRTSKGQDPSSLSAHETPGCSSVRCSAPLRCWI